MASYEKLKVLNVSFRTNNDTKEVTHFVEFEQTKNIRCNFKNAAQLNNLHFYQNSIGQELLVSLREGVMDGRAWTAFDGDAFPIPVPVLPTLNTDSPILGTVDASTGEILPVDSSLISDNVSSSIPVTESNKDQSRSFSSKFKTG